MDRKIGYIFVALIAALLYFVAIGYPGWFCGESILGPTCGQLEVSKTTGGLLVTAGLLIVIAAILLIVSLMKNLEWASTGAAIVTTMSAIIATVGVFYYLHQHYLWSPLIATMAMSFTMALSAILLTSLIGGTSQTTSNTK